MIMLLHCVGLTDAVDFVDPEYFADFVDFVDSEDLVKWRTGGYRQTL